MSAPIFCRIFGHRAKVFGDMNKNKFNVNCLVNFGRSGSKFVFSEQLSDANITMKYSLL